MKILIEELLDLHQLISTKIEDILKKLKFVLKKERLIGQNR
jgi:hypothetical protein